ncbi:MAG: histidine phosphatase family protein [Bacteroidota bacterium]
MLTIYLIRHAESMGNVNHHLIGGQSNHYHLSERGEEQADILGQRLKREGYRFDQVYASEAIRAQQTARIALDHVGLPFDQVKITPLILELSQGEWEGAVRKEIYTAERKAAILADSYTFKAPGGESQQDVEQRMFQWMEAAKDAAADGQVIAGFTHGFAIKTLVRKMLGADASTTYRTIIHNTSISCFQFDYGKNAWFMERVNDFQHLHGQDFIGHYG